MLPFRFCEIRDGRFEIARFVAHFLLESLPENPLDRDIIEYLRSIDDGTRNLPPFDSYCKFPREPEYYLKTLNWRMVELAEDGKRFAQAERQTFRAMRKMGRGKEYLDSNASDRFSIIRRSDELLRGTHPKFQSPNQTAQRENRTH